jgi:hypothetical protein
MLAINILALLDHPDAVDPGVRQYCLADAQEEVVGCLLDDLRLRRLCTRPVLTALYLHLMWAILEPEHDAPFERQAVALQAKLEVVQAGLEALKGGQSPSDEQKEAIRWVFTCLPDAWED